MITLWWFIRMYPHHQLRKICNLWPECRPRQFLQHSFKFSETGWALWLLQTIVYDGRDAVWLLRLGHKRNASPIHQNIHSQGHEPLYKKTDYSEATMLEKLHGYALVGIPSWASLSAITTKVSYMRAKASWMLQPVHLPTEYHHWLFSMSCETKNHLNLWSTKLWDIR